MLSCYGAAAKDAGGGGICPVCACSCSRQLRCAGRQRRSSTKQRTTSAALCWKIHLFAAIRRPRCRLARAPCKGARLARARGCTPAPSSARLARTRGCTPARLGICTSDGPRVGGCRGTQSWYCSTQRFKHIEAQDLPWDSDSPPPHRRQGPSNSRSPPPGSAPKGTGKHRPAAATVHAGGIAGVLSCYGAAAKDVGGGGICPACACSRQMCWSATECSKTKRRTTRRAVDLRPMTHR